MVTLFGLKAIRLAKSASAILDRTAQIQPWQIVQQRKVSKRSDTLLLCADSSPDKHESVKRWGSIDTVDDRIEYPEPLSLFLHIFHCSFILSLLRCEWEFGLRICIRFSRGLLLNLYLTFCIANHLNSVDYSHVFQISLWQLGRFINFLWSSIVVPK